MARDRAKEALLEAHIRLGGEVHLHARGVPSPVRTQPYNITVGYVRYMTKPSKERRGPAVYHGPPPRLVPGAKKYMPSSYVTRDYWSGLLFKGQSLLADVDIDPMAITDLQNMLEVLRATLLRKYVKSEEV